MGPGVSRVCARGRTPWQLTRPNVTLRPVSPFHADGIRTEPPVSDPMAHGARRAATETPEPELLPPGARCTVRSQGFHGVPMCRLVPHAPIANSTVRVLPSTMAPAATRRRARVAVVAETRFSQTFEPPVVIRPSRSMMSLSAIGTPWKRPTAWPDRRARSAARAAARASSA